MCQVKFLDCLQSTLNLLLWLYQEMKDFSSPSQIWTKEQNFFIVYYIMGVCLVQWYIQWLDNTKKVLISAINLGRPPKHFVVLTPPPLMFYCILRKKFRKFSKFVLLILAIFFERFPKISKKIVKFSQLFQSRKKLYFWPKVVQDHYID